MHGRRPLATLLAVALAIAGRDMAQGQIGIEAVPADRIEPPAALLGTWGTAAQCAAEESPSPTRIGREWIEQGGIYCLVSWQASYRRGDGLETLAHAQCGEDTLREYRIFLLLDGERLRIRWSDTYTTPALSRCG